MKFSLWLKQLNLRVGFYTRFSVSGQGSTGTGKLGDNQPYYCGLRCTQTGSSVNHLHGHTSSSITGNGNTLREAFADLVRHIEEIAEACEEIGVCYGETTWRTSFIPDKFDTSDIQFPVSELEATNV